MLDQTRFISVQTGDEVIRQLYLKDDLRKIEGDNFTLNLVVSIPFADEVVDGTITLIVDRPTARRVVYQHPNGDVVFQTTARLEPHGEAFEISLTPPNGTSDFEGAAVTVSPKMERIILDYLDRRDRGAA